MIFIQWFGIVGISFMTIILFGVTIDMIKYYWKDRKQEVSEK